MSIFRRTGIVLEFRAGALGEEGSDARRTRGASTDSPGSGSAHWDAGASVTALRTSPGARRSVRRRAGPRGGSPAGTGEDFLDEGIDQPVVGLRSVPPHAVADAVEQHQAHKRIGHLRGVRSHVAAAGC